MRRILLVGALVAGGNRLTPTEPTGETSPKPSEFSKLIDEMVEIETKGTHDYLAVLEKLGRPAPPIDERLEHILITGMFNTFFELIIHEMPLEEAKRYLKEMRAFYTAGWMKIMGQSAL